MVIKTADDFYDKLCIHDVNNCCCGNFKKYLEPKLGDINDWKMSMINYSLDITHCICKQRIDVGYKIIRTDESEAFIIGSTCFERFTGENIKIVNNSNKLEKYKKVIRKKKRDDEMDHLISKCINYVKTHYGKHLLQGSNSEIYFPVIWVILGKIKKNTCDKLIEFNIFKHKIKNVKIPSTKMTRKYNIDGDLLLESIRENNNIISWLYSKDLINDNTITYIHTFLNLVNKKYMDNFTTRLRKDGPVHKFKDMLKWVKNPEKCNIFYYKYSSLN